MHLTAYYYPSTEKRSDLRKIRDSFWQQKNASSLEIKPVRSAWTSPSLCYRFICRYGHKTYLVTSKVAIETVEGISANNRNGRCPSLHFSLFLLLHSCCFKGRKNEWKRRVLPCLQRIPFAWEVSVGIQALRPGSAWGSFTHFSRETSSASAPSSYKQGPWQCSLGSGFLQRIKWPEGKGTSLPCVSHYICQSTTFQKLHHNPKLVSHQVTVVHVDHIFMVIISHDNNLEEEQRLTVQHSPGVCLLSCSFAPNGRECSVLSFIFGC